MFGVRIEARKSGSSGKLKPSSNEPETNDELPPFFCPVCDARMTLRDVRPVAGIKLKDVRRHEMRCDDCGMMVDRIYHPAIGYDRTIAL